MSGTGDPQIIREEIESTREELGETVEALAAKADVAGQAKRKLEETRHAVTGKADDVMSKARAATPESAAGVFGQLVGAAKENPVAFVAGALLLGFLIGHRRG